MAESNKTPAAKAADASKKTEVRAEGDFRPTVTPEEHLNETHYQMDEPILDPESPLATQVPEGVGADASDVKISLSEQLKQGSPEAIFAAGGADEPTGRDKADR